MSLLDRQPVGDTLQAVSQDRNLDSRANSPSMSENKSVRPASCFFTWLGWVLLLGFD